MYCELFSNKSNRNHPFHGLDLGVYTESHKSLQCNVRKFMLTVLADIQYGTVDKNVHLICWEVARDKKEINRDAARKFSESLLYYTVIY